MTAERLIVIGGGEHARVVIEVARSRPDRWVVQGFLDPDPNTAFATDAPYLGDDDTLRARFQILELAARAWLVLGFAGATDLAARTRAVARFDADQPWATVVHAAAHVSPSAGLGDGTVVLAGAVVNTGAQVGRHAIINSGAIVEHDVVVGDGSHLAPGALVGGGTIIGEGVFIGLGARIRDHIEIGAGAVVGMGAVVVDSIAPGATVVGIPARTLETGRG